LLFYFSHKLFSESVRATRNSRLSVAFSTDAPTFLNQSGPYRAVRHPFYVAYTLSWTAAAVASAHPASFAILLFMLAFYFIAGRLEERKFLASPHAAAYEHYRRRAGMFLPRLVWKSNNRHVLPSSPAVPSTLPAQGGRRG